MIHVIKRVQLTEQLYNFKWMTPRTPEAGSKWHQIPCTILYVYIELNVFISAISSKRPRADDTHAAEYSAHIQFHCTRYDVTLSSGSEQATPWLVETDNQLQHRFLAAAAAVMDAWCHCVAATGCAWYRHNTTQQALWHSLPKQSIHWYSAVHSVWLAVNTSGWWRDGLQTRTSQHTAVTPIHSELHRHGRLEVNIHSSRTFTAWSSRVNAQSKKHTVFVAKRIIGIAALCCDYLEKLHNVHLCDMWTIVSLQATNKEQCLYFTVPLWCSNTMPTRTIVCSIFE